MTNDRPAHTPTPCPFAERFRGVRVHLIGIGGSGMNGAASLLLEASAIVSGSDRTPFPGMGDLVSRGARIAIGHRPEAVDPDVELVIVTAAIPDSNSELRAARSLGVRIVKYADFIAEVMTTYQTGVAIAGTHGKSTTTAMCAFLFARAGLAPGFLFGAHCPQLGGGSGIGSGGHFIVESCEFDRSFLQLAPQAAAVLNIERDHLDYYGGLGDIVDAFTRFSENVAAGGLLIFNGDDPHAASVAGASSANAESFGFSAGSDWRAVNLLEEQGCFQFDLHYRGRPLFPAKLTIPGRHNVANALAAIALAHHAGAEPEALAEAIGAFTGINRRLSWCGESRGVTIIDDYAHHPTEIRTSIEAVLHQYRPKRTWVVFQPHQRSRTHHLMDDFARSFEGADEIIVPDVYEARDAAEADGPNGSVELVQRLRRSGASVQHLPDLASVADHLVDRVVEGDLVLTMGAGDIWKVADELVARI